MTRPDRGAVSATSGGISFAGALTLLFIGLRLSGVIDWPWVWVLAPLWISAVVVLVLGLFVILGVVLARRVSDRRRDARLRRPPR